MKRDPLLENLRAGLDGLRRPAPTPETSRHVTEPAAAATWCDVKKRATRKGYCRVVRCHECPYLAEALGEEREHVAWLCSSCARVGKGLGFWADGRCEMCSEESIVLALTRVPV